MKRALVLSLLTSAVVASAPVHGQGYILLDNYSSSGPRVRWLGGELYSPFTVGLYYALGDVVGSIPADPTGVGVPGGPLTLGTGPGSTAPISYSPSPLSGYFSAVELFAVPDSNPRQIITIELIAYSGADYASSQYRGHTDPFTMTALPATAVPPSAVGYFMPYFVLGFLTPPPPPSVPEPSGLLLTGMGIASLLIVRRRKHSGLDSPDVFGKQTHPAPSCPRRCWSKKLSD